MGKKSKKKAARNAQKEKRFPNSSPKTVSQEIIPANDTVVNGVSVVKETQTCPHLDKGIDLEKFSLKMSSLESLKCEDCREGVADRRTKKGKGKTGKNKVSGSKSESMSIWVCLECGHFSCGGVGFPTTPQSHGAWHAKQNRHPLVLQFANPNLRWCFLCNTLIPVQSSDENGEEKDVLTEFVEVLKTRSSSETRVDVEDIWFGNGSVTSGIKSLNTLSTLPSYSENQGGYMVRGLVNLGNTCFFNSVLQNLLAMDKLRDYLLNLEGPVGPLTVSLKKLFIETSPSTGARNVINPRSFFGCVCAKAPQFKGFQQHDSHELLRCLLDGLCTEESNVRKRSQNVINIPKNAPTFVDAIFGGQISSTVSCLECGHASVVYEPYLDLSLPLPNKKSLSKRVSSVSRSKKPKLPPKRHGKFRSKTKKPSEKNVVVDGISDKNDSALQKAIVLQENGIKQIRDSTVISSENLVQQDYDNVTKNSSNVLDHSEATMPSNGHYSATYLSDVSVTEHTGKKELVDLEETSWLDYLEPATSNNRESSVIQDSGNNNNVFLENEPQPKVKESEVTSTNGGNEVTLSSITSEQEFDGFGGLFDEPKTASGPTVNPLSNGVEESESDPDEVDDTDSDFPVSVEKCLAYFTTPELLTKTEHAWQCEQCLKSLLEQKTRLKNNKLQIPVSNGVKNGISSVPSDSGIDHLHSNGFRNPNNDRSSESQDAESCSVNGPTELDSSEDDEVDSKGVKVARDASKRILISRAPSVLTIHLKRFCQDARGRLSKLNGHVNFRDTIDLKPYMDPSCCRDRDTYKYQLVGVVEHLGTMRGGHYVAYVKGGSKGNTVNDNCLWYHASDAYVREASLEEVLQCEAYILFYEEIIQTK